MEMDGEAMRCGRVFDASTAPYAIVSLGAGDEGARVRYANAPMARLLRSEALIDARLDGSPRALGWARLCAEALAMGSERERSGARAWPVGDGLCALSPGAAVLEAFGREDLATAVDESALFIYVIDPDTCEILYDNRAIREQSGATHVGLKCHSAFCGLPSPCEMCPARMLRETGKPHTDEIRRADGRWMLAEASPLCWQGREATMLVCIDVSKYVRITEELRMRCAENAIVIAQSGKRVFRYDIAAKRLRGYAASDGRAPGEEDLSPSEMLESGYVTAESADNFRAFVARIESGEPTGALDFSVRGGSSSPRWLHADYTLIPDERNSYAVISVFDNTDLIEKELAYQKWQNSLSSIIAGSAIYMEVNLTRNAIEREVGVKHCPEGTLTAFVDYGCRHIVYGEDAPSYRAFFERERLLALYAGGAYEDSLEYRARGRDGEKWYKAVAQMVKYPYSDEIKAFIAFSDVDEAHRELEKLSQLALRDSLTKLYNHDATARMAAGLLSEATDTDDFALFMLDLDNFKSVNDKLGHQDGDQMLIKAAGVIADTFRSSDIVGRIGGDEFMVFMAGSAKASVVRKKAEALVESLQIRIGGVEVSASVGVAMASGGAGSFEKLYSVADQALYVAKKAGKNRYHIVDSDGKSGVDGLPKTLSGTVQLQTLLEYMDGGVVLADVGEEISIVYTSPSFYKTLHHSRAEAGKDGAKLLELVYKPDLPALKAALRLAAEGGTVIDHTYRANEGGTDWRHLRAVRLPGGTQGKARLIGVITDISELKRSEEKLRFAEMRYRTAIERTDVFLWEVDIATRTLICVSDPCELWDCGADAKFANAPEGFINAEYVQESSEAEYRRMFERLYAGDDSGEYAIELACKKGALWTKNRFTILRGGDGAPYYAIGVAEPVPNIEAEMRKFALEERFREQAESSLLASMRVDLSQNRIETMRVAEGRLAIDESERYDGLDLTACVYHADYGALADNISRERLIALFAGGQEWLFTDYRRLSPAGELRWTSSALHLTRHPVSGDIYAFHYVYDIDASKRWERSLVRPAEREALSLLYTRDSFETMASVMLSSRQRGGLCSLCVFTFTGLRALDGGAADSVLRSVVFSSGRALRLMASGSAVAGQLDNESAAVFRTGIQSASEETVRVARLREQLSLMIDATSGGDGFGLAAGLAIMPLREADYRTLMAQAMAACARAAEREDGALAVYGERGGWA